VAAGAGGGGDGSGDDGSVVVRCTTGRQRRWCALRRTIRALPARWLEAVATRRRRRRPVKRAYVTELPSSTTRASWARRLAGVARIRTRCPTASGSPASRTARVPGTRRGVRPRDRRRTGLLRPGSHQAAAVAALNAARQAGRRWASCRTSAATVSVTGLAAARCRGRPGEARGRDGREHAYDRRRLPDARSCGSRCHRSPSVTAAAAASIRCLPCARLGWLLQAAQYHPTTGAGRPSR
jgi:hypothetical protein